MCVGISVEDDVFHEVGFVTEIRTGFAEGLPGQGHKNGEERPTCRKNLGKKTTTKNN